jgi:hypothetical protein
MADGAESGHNAGTRSAWPLILTLVASHFLQDPPRHIVFPLASVNAASGCGHASAPHDAPVAIVAGGGSEYVRAGARRGLRPRNPPERADVPCGERIGDFFF